MSRKCGGHRPGAGRKPDPKAQQLRADLKKRLPTALKAVDDILADAEHPQHASIAKWVVDKQAANLKPETAPVEFDLLGDTPAEQARSIVEAAAAGKLSPTTATELLTAVASCLKIIEISELVERVESLENNRGAA